MGMGLPPVMMKRGGGGFDMDTDLLKEQEKSLAKMYNKDGEYQDPFAQSKNEEGKSLKDMLREKREATEKELSTK